MTGHVLASMAVALLVVQAGAARLAAAATTTDDACLTTDTPCATKAGEGFEAYCQRVVQARDAKGPDGRAINPGYVLAHCDSGYDIRWVPPKERPAPTAPGSAFSEVKAVSISATPVLHPPDADLGLPIAETAGGVVKVGILAYDRAVGDEKHCRHKHVIVPSDAKAGSIAFETLDNAITAFAMIDVARSGRSREALGQFDGNAAIRRLDHDDLLAAIPARGQIEALRKGLAGNGAAEKSAPLAAVSLPRRIRADPGLFWKAMEERSEAAAKADPEHPLHFRMPEFQETMDWMKASARAARAELIRGPKKSVNPAFWESTLDALETRMAEVQEQGLPYAEFVNLCSAFADVMRIKVEERRVGDNADAARLAISNLSGITSELTRESIANERSRSLSAVRAPYFLVPTHKALSEGTVALTLGGAPLAYVGLTDHQLNDGEGYEPGLFWEHDLGHAEQNIAGFADKGVYRPGAAFEPEVAESSRLAVALERKLAELKSSAKEADRRRADHVEKMLFFAVHEMNNPLSQLLNLSFLDNAAIRTAGILPRAEARELEADKRWLALAFREAEAGKK